MKPFFLPIALCLLFACNQSFSQTKVNVIHFGASNATDFHNSLTGFEASWEHFVNNKFSIEYGLAVGGANDGGWFFRTGGGQALGIALLSIAAGSSEHSDQNPLAWLGVIFLMIPETLTLSIQEAKYFTVKGYLRPVSTYYFESKTFQALELGSELGIKLQSKFYNNVTFTPYAGIKPMYTHGVALFTAGATIGFVL